MSLGDSGVSLTFFVVIAQSGAANTLLRIKLDAEAQKILSKAFLEQAEGFKPGKCEVHDFHHSYTPSLGTLTRITEFALPQVFHVAFAKPQEISLASFPHPESKGSIVAIVGLRSSPQPPGFTAYFQSFDRRRILDKGRFLSADLHTLKKSTETAITIGNKLAAVAQNGQLLFESYKQTNRFLDLTSYFKEASDSEIREVLGSPILRVVDSDYVLGLCTSTLRRKFAVVIRLNVLNHERVTPNRIQAGMKHYYGLSLDIKIDQNTKQRRIVFPTEASEIGKLLEYLSHGVYTTHLTEEDRSTNSHRPLISP